MTATAQAGSQTVTLAREIGAARHRCLAHRRRWSGWRARAGPASTPAALAASIDAIEAAPPLHALLPIALVDGGRLGLLLLPERRRHAGYRAAAAGGGLGQAARTLLSRKGFNQFAMTALCAVLATGLYCLIVLGFGIRTFALAHAVGFISSVLFLVPGFPLVAALLDLMQHQTTAGIARLFYGLLLTSGRRLRRFHRCGTRRPHAGDGRGRRPGHRADDPAVARRGLLRRRLRLRHPLQQPAAHGARRRRPVDWWATSSGWRCMTSGWGCRRRRSSARCSSACWRRWCASRCTCRVSRSPCPASS